MTGHLLQEWPSDKVCVLRLNRPEAYNALSRRLTDDLRTAIGNLESSGACVLVLAANGNGFCAGADLKERKLMSDDEKFSHNRAINALANEIAALPIPTVAAINGSALGGGVEISLACDLRFAVEGAKLGLTAARIGAMPGAGGTQRLPRLIGTARALEMMYSGEPVTAEKAADWGLVNDTVAAGQLMQRVMDFAQITATRSPRSTARLKRSVYKGLDTSLADGLEVERREITEILKSDDYKEGLAAFAERRAPNFR